MIKGSIAGCLLVLTPLPALAGDFGGLTLTSTCDQYNKSSGSNRAGFVHDLIVGTSAATGKDYQSHRVDIQACVAATFAPPCVTGTTSIREVLAACMLMVGN
ncbi:MULTISPECIES: hypothetical protein [Mesorhizobium]|uniref:Uncharacterized protein n=3 Tax=Mesorhizobium TaxID=68287 RepID=Q8KGL9_RHILI|nr:MULTISPECIES: hypothetical protein [Mesorhizobium]MBZ9909441.1 hypothetical protein [Mesorhizobium sp. BR115XR7A]QJF04837.1 hypothetical protein R7A2020_30340 [Mesorhizobium japonicum R7A]QJF10906.1 hypothetical protein HID05_30330 [Mesorhizobium japonicum]QJI86779.1 hypothetical protein HKB46_30340 [Mesorhizobium japonicum]WQB96867.1 hypothetical protein U0R22_000940 [Mesorhizobium huakuii]